MPQVRSSTAHLRLDRKFEPERLPTQSIRPAATTPAICEPPQRNGRKPASDDQDPSASLDITTGQKADLLGNQVVEQILPFNRSLHIALLIVIALLTAVIWALLLWGVSAFIQLAVNGTQGSASALLSESTLWITAVVWPIAFLGLGIVCLSNDRDVAEQNSNLMNHPRKSLNSWHCQD